MLDTLRFSAYQASMSLLTLVSFRTQQVSALGLPSADPVSGRPYGESFPMLPLDGLLDPTDLPADEAGRLRRIEVSTRALDLVRRLAPERTRPVPGASSDFLRDVYPRLLRQAWPKPPAVPPSLTADPVRGVPDTLAVLAVEGPFASCLQASPRHGGFMIDLDWMLGYPARPGLLAPGGVAHFSVVDGALRTTGLSRGGDDVPLSSWRGRQIERDAMLAGMNEDLTTFRHNVLVHLATLTPFAIASVNRLESDHPVRRLLHHCFHTVLVGNHELASFQLSGPSAFGATIFSHDHVQIARMAADRLSRYDFWDFEPDAHFAARGTAQTPFPYPYRDNVLELWAATLDYARRYLALYFDEPGVRSDPQVRAWLDDLNRLLPAPLGTPADLSVEWLARLCATLIHVSTVEHDVLNNVAWDYSTLGWLVPTVAPVTGERMDRRRAFDLIATLIVTWKPYAMLLSADVPSLALDAAGRAVMSEWIADLARIQRDMLRRGWDRSLSYPANLNVSISN